MTPTLSAESDASGNGEEDRAGLARSSSISLFSAAAAGAAAAFADIAGAGGTHLRTAGHAHGRVSRLALELLEQVLAGVDLQRDLARRGGAGTGLHLVGGQVLALDRSHRGHRRLLGRG